MFRFYKNKTHAAELPFKLLRLIADKKQLREQVIGSCDDSYRAGEESNQQLKFVQHWKYRGQTQEDVRRKKKKAKKRNGIFGKKQQYNATEQINYIHL